ncbi:FAD-dependent oxidoreductase [Agrobacterium rubi]|uniref:FAD/NAD(P)-binding protein n=1 Tax=Agrobacterium rubi TaxID=28099 RepID=UPI0015725293|nr:FAD/NAD(P)-binding protein [Agrobacterium rubi]MCL6652685.1 hypothetical protein [Agrobacterium rubi]NTF09784.1 FAD-dependent oxidoreductase [Agrobacterium rubi]NTF22039.1 FAD-dependent oxidoreductase [Agrobacterium rubi]NTF28896.1 FAD-dependent oxidoreductase [Agrobacterium rubi]
MSNRVCIIGSGPTGIYTFQHLSSSPKPLSITIYEAENYAGKGTPYLPTINDPAMLSNIPSIEIPPLGETLVDWLRGRDDEYLSTFGIVRSSISERQFYPRLVLGDYFHDQFLFLKAQAEKRGHKVDIRVQHRVRDIALETHDIRLKVEASGEAFDAVYDHVVMATGHNWPESTETHPGYFMSAWPASALQSIEGGRLGILGTSLSAIDALMTVATSCGSFIHDSAGNLQYQPSTGREDFHAVLMSRKGLLPEADFYCPLPYMRPRVCTPEAINALIASGSNGLLDKVFELFRSEIVLADPHYAAEIGLSQLTVDTFASAYYARRSDIDPFVWAAANLAEAKQNAAAEFTVPWRYAIMITHEIIAKIVPHLDTDDFARFNKSFKGIFIDEYATVPHLSIERLLALRNAGRIEILKLGGDYDITKPQSSRGACVAMGEKTERFDNFIDATGQSALSARELPFPTLVNQETVRKAPTPEPSGFMLGDNTVSTVRLGGIDVDESYRTRTAGTVSNRLYCAAIPFLLHKNPFVQGITSAAETGEIVAHAIIDDLNHVQFTELLSA